MYKILHEVYFPWDHDMGWTVRHLYVNEMDRWDMYMYVSGRGTGGPPVESHGTVRWDGKFTAFLGQHSMEHQTA